jgi:hypothetical protein
MWYVFMYVYMYLFDFSIFLSMKYVLKEEVDTFECMYFVLSLNLVQRVYRIV